MFKTEKYGRTVQCDVCSLISFVTFAYGISGVAGFLLSTGSSNHSVCPYHELLI